MTYIERHQQRLLERLESWFTTSPLNSMWVTSGPIRVYMRKTPLPRPAVGGLVPALTLANIQVRQDMQRRGSLALVVGWMHRQPVQILKVENVLSESLALWLQKRGWASDNAPLTPSFLKVMT